MCTVLTLKGADCYFARNLDMEKGYFEQVCITPRNYPFSFCFEKTMYKHYAMIGMAYVVDDYPLYYDAVNEKGIAIAALEMKYNTYYTGEEKQNHKVSVYELIPWILTQCATLEEVIELLKNTEVVAKAFHEKLPISPLHYLIYDGKKSVVVEFLKEGMQIEENEYGVLTNNPIFPMMKQHLYSYLSVNNTIGNNYFSNALDFPIYSSGMGSIGLPGDFTSPSRFVKTVFMKFNSHHKNDETSCVNQCFHILGNVEMVEGSVCIGQEQYEKTIYTCCMNTSKQRYYYKTYDQFTICYVDLHKENLEKDGLVLYPLQTKQNFVCENDTFQ